MFKFCVSLLKALNCVSYDISWFIGLICYYSFVLPSMYAYHVAKVNDEIVSILFSSI